VSGKTAAFVALAVVLAALFVALGFWQLRRLDERRARNGVIAARMAQGPVPIAALRDTLSYRRATVSGRPDHANEIILTGRSRNGSPGVYILTPVRPSEGNDSATVVIRGWVYAPDAATADLSRWREARAVFTGYTAMLPSASESPHATGAAGARKIRALSASGVRALLPYAVTSRYLVSQDSAADTAPARLAPPALDDGPHLSYAIQWFCFAVIALVGAGAIVFRARVSPDKREWGTQSTGQ